MASRMYTETEEIQVFVDMDAQIIEINNVTFSFTGLRTLIEAAKRCDIQQLSLRDQIVYFETLNQKP